MPDSASNAIETPNFYTLAGRGIAITITITMSGLDGAPQVTYHDSRQAVSFSGKDAVSVQDSVLGTLVSFTTVRTVDLGDTTFTVILPVINLSGGNNHVDTIGIITLHRTSLAPGLGHGQLSATHAIRLRGSASQIQT